MAEIFRRVEKKYIITQQQYQILKEKINDFMIQDEHGESTICNIYFDNERYDLIRHSISKPTYKDKIRLRSYNTPNLNSKVFLEIKRKFDGVVSKRRIEIGLNDYYKLKNNKEFPSSQIENEIYYYFKLYNLRPTVYLSYYRNAYYGMESRDFRITFDSNVLARAYDLYLENGSYGNLILEPNKYIMEVKTLGAMPMWFVKILNDLEIMPCGFSKYGEAYTQLILESNGIGEYVV